MKFVVNAGHSMDTPGKRTPDGVREFEFNYPTAKYLKQYLEEYKGVEVLLIGDPNRDIPLKERTDKGNAWGADAWLSVHYNAYGTGGWNDSNGVEVWVYESKPKESTELAGAVQAALVKATGRHDRGVKFGNLHELRETKMTAILAECGFMTNKKEAATMKDAAFQKKVARAYADAVAEFYGLKKGSDSKSKGVVPEPKSKLKSATAWTGQILRKGDNGPLVKSLQNILISRGFSLPKYGADGHFGDETERAVRAAQRATGISVDGVAGPQTYKAIKNYDGSSFHFLHWNGEIIRNGERGSHVKELQGRLLALGYKLPKYGADGVMGGETANAVRKFQRDAGIKVDGIPGPETKKALEGRG